MTDQHPSESRRDRPLFTPGPLTTSRTVKEAMLRDLGSRDHEFISTVEGIREDLLRLAGVSREAGYEVVIMQGSGTFGIEAVISSVTPPDGSWLILVNGAYGERIAKIASVYGIENDVLRFSEDEAVDPEVVREHLGSNSMPTHLALVHCETTSGVFNPVREVGALCREKGISFFVDSMSAFGAVPVSMEEDGSDYLVSSANKCIEGVPGFSFAIFRREALLKTEGFARTLSLDLLDQWKGLEKNGQFRFTPPTHSLLAFRRALDELEEEGGVSGRGARYAENHRLLREGMAALGFNEYVDEKLQGSIITSFRYPDHPSFDFEVFYNRLGELGFVIYPGKVSNADCFRIGSIGRLYPEDVKALLVAIGQTLSEMGVDQTQS